jgi:hypothetical protein
VTAVKLKAEGVMSGVPDIFIAHPVHPYHGLFIELKAKGGRATSEQRQWLLRLQEGGYKALLCIGLDAAINGIENYMREA